MASPGLLAVLSTVVCRCKRLRADFDLAMDDSQDRGTADDTHRKPRSPTGGSALGLHAPDQVYYAGSPKANLPDNALTKLMGLI
jgi:hypothetical protein